MEGCDRPHEVRGLCDKHYRAERYRDPELRRRQLDATRRYIARKRERALITAAQSSPNSRPARS